MKPYKTIDEQIAILQSRNMQIPSIEFARRILRYENYYYVVNGYKAPFLATTSPEDIYKRGTTFHELYALYTFDRNLREMLLADLLRIEHCIKSTIIDVFSSQHGYDHRSYLREESFNSTGPKNERRVSFMISDMLKLIDKQKRHHEAVQHYMQKYGSVPLWVLSKVMTFGKTNSFYACMKAGEKEDVAKVFGLNARCFKALTDYLAVFRNKCAHGERIYCHAHDQHHPRPIPQLEYHELLRIPRNQKGYKYGTQDILALLIAMKFFMQPSRYAHLIRKVNYSLNEKLSKRLHTIPVTDIENIMGLYQGWTSLPEMGLRET